MDKKKSTLFSNSLIHESSPYLLQHAHNPVDWYAWGEVALQKAKNENKALLISIGYSACHWCHVMEEESFMDREVAEIMNSHFVCIKVDREERPDIDQIYMTAAQIMTGSGGWPLNCFATSDGRPFFAGTYFPKKQWLDVLKQLSLLLKNNAQKVEEYANQLTEGVLKSELIIKKSKKMDFDMNLLQLAVRKWKSSFDTIEGGETRAPKFPLPNNYSFLLYFYFVSKDESVLKHIEHSLRKMAFGGIYDQIAGGFARYSTDTEWKVPHFEKMLYDNAQLISLYSEMYRMKADDFYKKTVEECLDFIEKELKAPNATYYSALDADSEGEEGKFYVWTKVELKQVIKEDYPLFKEYYNVNSKGYWEEDNYILLRNKEANEFAKEQKIDQLEFEKKLETWKQKLLEYRNKRVRPQKDDKSITSWNALMIKAYVDAFHAFKKEEYLNAAIQSANFILKEQMHESGKLFRIYKNGKSSINAYLDDYSLSIEAFISLYQGSFDEKWLELAKKLTEYCIIHFYDEKSGMFFYTSDEDPELIARKTEVLDNVIPSSNSSMAKGLFLLGKYFDNEKYIQISRQMLINMQEHLSDFLPSATNWGILQLHFSHGFNEVAIVGENYLEKAHEVMQSYLPNILILGSEKQSELPLLKNKYKQNSTLIYVCKNKACLTPVISIDQAQNLILNH